MAERSATLHVLSRGHWKHLLEHLDCRCWGVQVSLAACLAVASACSTQGPQCVPVYASICHSGQRASEEAEQMKQHEESKQMKQHTVPVLQA